MFAAFVFGGERSEPGVCGPGYGGCEGCAEDDGGEGVRHGEHGEYAQVFAGVRP